MGTGAKKGKGKGEEASVYKETVNLPTTSFGAPPGCWPVAAQGRRLGRARATAAGPPPSPLHTAAPGANLSQPHPRAAARGALADLRANSKTKEPELQKWWDDMKIYERRATRARALRLRRFFAADDAGGVRLAAENPGEPWVLHDGPPYANGDLHIGASRRRRAGPVPQPSYLGRPPPE
jgi:hypothetical protein